MKTFVIVLVKLLPYSLGVAGGEIVLSLKAKLVI